MPLRTKMPWHSKKQSSKPTFQEQSPPPPPVTPDKDKSMQAIHLPTNQVSASPHTGPKSARPSSAAAALRLLKRKHPKINRKTKPTDNQREVLSNRTNNTSTTTSTYTSSASSNNTTSSTRTTRNNRQQQPPSQQQRNNYRGLISAADITGSTSNTNTTTTTNQVMDRSMEVPPELPSEMDQLHAMGDSKFGKPRRSHHTMRRSRERLNSKQKSKATAVSIDSKRKVRSESTPVPEPQQSNVDHTQQAYDGSGSSSMLRKLEGQDDNEAFINVERMECPYCSRKFAPDSHKRHVVVCATNKNKPKAPPTAVECYTDKFGIRHGGRGSLATSARRSGEAPLDKHGRWDTPAANDPRQRPSSSQNSNYTTDTNKINAQTRRRKKRGGSARTSRSNSNTTTHSTQSNEKGAANSNGGDTTGTASATPAATTQPRDVNEERVLKLSNKWGELMFLLRKPIQSNETMVGTWQSAMNGVKFLQELQETANDLGVQQGTLSRWLLPFDNQTSLADQVN